MSSGGITPKWRLYSGWLTQVSTGGANLIAGVNNVGDIW